MGGGKPIAVLMLGAHCPATQALVGILKLLGPTAVSDRPSKPDNVSEDISNASPIEDFNEEVLRKLDRVRTDPKPLPQNWMSTLDAGSLLAKMSDLVPNPDAGDIFLDDPSLCRLSPLWQRGLEALGYTPHFLFVNSAPLELSPLLRNQFEVKQNHALLLWETYFLEAERDTRGQQRSHILYDALLENWRGELDQKLPYFAIDQLQDDDANRIDARLEDLARRRAISDPGEVAKMKPRIERLWALLQSGLDTGDVDELEKIRALWSGEWGKRSAGEGRSEFWDVAPKAIVAKSRKLASENQLEAAISEAAKAVRLEPGIADHHHYLASLLYRDNRLEAAEAAERKAIQLISSDANFHELLARILRARGRLDEAVAVQKTAVELDPGSAQRHYLLGMLTALNGKLEEAEKSYLRATELAPDNPHFFRSISETRRQLGRADEAIEPARRAVELGEATASDLLHLAKILAVAGQAEEAEQIFAEGLKLNDDDANILAPYRDHLERMGKSKEAAELSERLVELLPNSPQAKRDLADSYILLGEPQKAVISQSEAAGLSAEILKLAMAQPLDAKAFTAIAAILRGKGCTTQLDTFSILLSWSRASELSDRLLRPDEPTAYGDTDEAWPIGTSKPICEEPKIRRYGSPAAWLQRLMESLKRPEIETPPRLGTRPLISTMIPVYNPEDADWLHSCMECLLSQELDATDHEIVIVDDGSTDGIARDVAARFAPRVRYICNSNNLGIVENHNRCIRLARGEFVHILHQDDCLKPGFYERLLNPLLKDDGLVAGVARARIIDAAGSHRYDQPLLQNHSGIAEDFSEKIALRQRILFPSIIVRRSAYERGGGFSPSLIFAFDLEMWARLSSLGPIWYEPDIFVEYRTHESSVTNSLSACDRLVDGMRATALNLQHLDESRRKPVLLSALFRLLQREWARIVRTWPKALPPEDETLLEFLIGATIENPAKEKLIGAMLQGQEGLAAESEE